MTAGFNQNDTIPNAIDMMQWSFNQMIENEPGEVVTYNSGSSHLLSGIISKATGMSAYEFGKKYLFKPLGISNLKWTVDPKGYSFGGVD